MKIGNNAPCPCGSGKKFKRCHKGAVVTIQSSRFVVSIKESGTPYKVFAIRFYENKTKNISGIQIDFPYTKKHKGLLTLATSPANVIKTARLSLKIGGKVTSHNVKYSHWSDGIVHFSGDGKIVKTHDKKSFPLWSSVGHLFTIQAKGFSGFEEKIDGKKQTDKQFDIEIDMGNKSEESIFITGWWFSPDEIHTAGNHIDTVNSFTTATGVGYSCFSLAAPQDHSLSGKVLLLCIRREPFMTKQKGSHLLFLGGFDTKDIWCDLDQEFHFLALNYPVRGYKKVLSEIESADYLIDSEVRM